jgi:hypothetical protein
MIDEERRPNETNNSHIDNDQNNDEQKGNMSDNLRVEQAETTTELFPLSPLPVAKINHQNSFSSPIPASFASYEAFPYTRSPLNHNLSGFSPFPSTYPVPGLPKFTHQSYGFVYPPSVSQPPRNLTGEQGNSIGSDHANQDVQPHSLQHYPAHQVSYSLYPPSYFMQQSKADGFPSVSYCPHHQQDGSTYTYPYLPFSESWGKENQPKIVSSKDTSSGDITTPNALNNTSSVEVNSAPRNAGTMNVTDENRQLRERKNELARMREQKKRERIEAIRAKGEGQRTEEERRLLQRAESLRGRKNNRSRERSAEVRREMEVILQKPESLRTSDEIQLLNT